MMGYDDDKNCTMSNLAIKLTPTIFVLIQKRTQRQGRTLSFSQLAAKDYHRLCEIVVLSSFIIILTGLWLNIDEYELIFISAI
jgi:hypothetical protein